MESLIGRLTQNRTILADGAMGSLLQGWGFSGGQCLEALNLSQPEVIVRAVKAYCEAGAEILQTNTFGASPLRLERWGLANHCEEVNAAAVRIARQAAGNNAWVVGSVGPSGRHLQPFGDLEPAKLAASYRRQIAALVDAGVDAVNVETIMDVEEGVIAVSTAREIAPEIPVFASITLISNKNGWFMPFGSSVAQAIQRFKAAGAAVVGANCSVGMTAMIEIAGHFLNAANMPLIMKPNAGLPVVREGKTVWEETPEMFAEGAKRLRNWGVLIIGGCCGTTPSHIQAISRALRA